MIKAFVDCLPHCDGCPYWKTSYRENSYVNFNEAFYREIRISCERMASCERIFKKEKENEHLKKA